MGMGWDHRYVGKDTVGSALLYRKKVVHMAFFSAEGAERTGRIADFQSRRGYRL